MTKLKDITGQTFGEWVVLYRMQERQADRRYMCRCSCGKEKPVDGGSLRSGKTSSCGHLARENQMKKIQTQWDELIGETVGFLTIQKVIRNTAGETKIQCLCACGKEKTLIYQLVVSGIVKSCGCLNRMLSSERMKIRNAQSVKEKGRGPNGKFVSRK